MTDFTDWREFDYQQAAVQLWVFKKSTTDKRFKAWHVRTDVRIETLFRDAIVDIVSKTTEKLDYSPISQNNENSCLVHALESSEGLLALLAAVDLPEADNIDAELKHLKGAAGYLVKFQHDDNTVYAVRKTAPTWKPKVRNTVINAIFHNGELSVTPEETFSFDSFFDFFCINETVFVKSKRAYESTMSEKSAYKKNFDDLVVEPTFNSIFSDIEPLKAYVGTNSMQLRRITVIQSKALYLRPNFPQRLQEINGKRNFGLNFDDNGKLIVCKDTAKTVLQVLLDHRLLSEITDTIYDVPDAEVV